MMTLSELRDAYVAGRLTDPLWIDNDETFAYQDDGEVEVFSMHPAQLLEECLDLLGIPHQGV